MNIQEDERNWIERAGDGDVEAFGYLYERYVDRIYRFALFRLGNHADAEDVTEHVFLKMMERISSFTWNGSGSFMAWLYRVAYNQVVDTVRLRQRRPEVDLETLHDNVPTEDGDPQGHIVQQDFMRQVSNCMEALTELQLQVILLKYGAEMSNTEIAEVLDRTPGTVAAVQHQTLKKLRGLMKIKGYPTYMS